MLTGARLLTTFALFVVHFPFFLFVFFTYTVHIFVTHFIYLLCVVHFFFSRTPHVDVSFVFRAYDKFFLSHVFSCDVNSLIFESWGQ